MELADRWLAATALVAVVVTRVVQYPKTYYGNAMVCLAAALAEPDVPVAVYALRIAAAASPVIAAATPRPHRSKVDPFVYIAAGAVALAPLFYRHASDAAWIAVPLCAVGCALDALGVATIRVTPVFN
ncbi:MAG: hypothetical protein ACPG1A_11850 [Halioglobus sp.]